MTHSSLSPLDTIKRGASEIIKESELAKKLASGKKLRIKLGADPTASDLHLGHAIVLRKLREFQKLGHTIVFIIGDYTAKIGDPSGKIKTRPPITDTEIEHNAKTYFTQVGTILDLQQTEVRYNSEWLGKLDFADIIKIASQFSTWRILERDDFTNRHASGKELLLHELLYPIMQAYDSVMVHADVEIGGTDQKFNLLAGRDLQRKMGLPEQDIITCPLLVGLDGTKKMSKSLGNFIGITDPPIEMFGKLMSIPDTLIEQYTELLTTSDAMKEINALLHNKKNPRDVKIILAHDIVSQFHSAAAAQLAAEEFDRVFRGKQSPTDMPTVSIKEKNLSALELVMQCKLATSKSEARRLFAGNAITIDGKKVASPDEIIAIRSGIVVKVGKRKFAKIA